MLPVHSLNLLYLQSVTCVFYRSHPPICNWQTPLFVRYDEAILHVTVNDFVW